jgi:hypothetical protein
MEDEKGNEVQTKEKEKRRVHEIRKFSKHENFSYKYSFELLKQQ